ncbi:MAG: UDP-N-acetylglucosamine 4,6-dehydratase (inverting) [Alphaproteobacteria bacterium]|nr:UDP-N-acetylglucosamine 4,6-dehydratase (inverting) [Alphaproteobacteria bacterium]
MVHQDLSNMPDLDGASVMVTGGTGSFGQAFVRGTLARFKPRKLIVFSRDELKQHEMQQHPDFRAQECMRYFIGDVRDADRLEMAMRDVDYVIHAAALKQVPAAEYNPFECIRTNVHGAENIVTASIRTDVKKVIALSTDKAANPINLYGASKLAADKIFVAANNLSGGQPVFSVVRYGNVAGSRGSVVPFFRQLVEAGADEIPITDPRMTRFWITIQQGVEFVLSCLASMHGGEIFVPKIPSMKVVDVAEALAPGLPHATVGIRPGEKLHEVMVTEDDARSTVELEDRYVILRSDDQNLHRIYAESGARALDEGFSYASDTNSEWLDHDGFRALVNATASPVQPD